MAKKKATANLSPRIDNRKARHDYTILEKFEVGIVLRGTEVKSIRHAQVSLGEGFALVEGNELFLHNVDIAHWPHAGDKQHEPKRRRKLLARRQQIKSLTGHTTAAGVTLVPLAMYFVRGKVKIELGIAQGKRSYDKRQTIKSRDAEREMRKAMTRKRI